MYRLVEHVGLKYFVLNLLVAIDEMADIKENTDASRIYFGHRALGLVSNHIPLVTRYVTRRKETLITTVIGNSFHTYGVRKVFSILSPLPTKQFVHLVNQAWAAQCWYSARKRNYLRCC